MDVVVEPARPSVHLGQDASFSCLTAGGSDPQEYYWQISESILDDKRTHLEDMDRTINILDTTAADNNTDVTCIILRNGDVQGIGSAQLVVLPALPSTETAPATPPTPRATAPQTPKLTAASTTNVVTTTETLRPTTQAAQTTRQEVTYTESVAPSSTAVLSSKMLTNSHKGLDGPNPVTVAPAVVGSLLLIVVVILTGFFLIRRSRRKSSGDIEKASPAVDPVLEFVPPSGGVDFCDDGSYGDEDEENHNLKRGHNKNNQDSLRTYSRGTAPDSVTRYARAVPRKDRIVRGGGGGLGGGKLRGEPVLTLSMNSLYEETTPTFIVMNNSKNGYAKVPPVGTPTNGTAVEIRGEFEPATGEKNPTSTEREDTYVTLAQSPTSPAVAGQPV